MAWSSFGAIAGTSQKTSASSWGFAPSAQLDAGHVGVLCFATDNLTTTDGNTSDHQTVTDTAGNTWTKRREFTNGQGSAAAGVTVSIWTTVAVANLATSGTITLTLSGAVVAKAVSGWEFGIAAGSSVSVVGSGDRADDGVDPGSITVSGLANTEHLFVRATGVEDPVSMTASTNYAGFNQGFTTGGSAPSNITCQGEFRILTATSDSTDPSASAADCASTMVALDEVAAASKSLVYPTRTYRNILLRR